MAQVDICIYPSSYSLSASELAKYDVANRYTSMSTMEAGTDIDWVTATDNPVVDILGGDESNNWSGSPDTGETTFNGGTFSTDYPILIQALGTAAITKTTQDSSAYILQGDGSPTIYLDSDAFYGQFKGIQIEYTGSTGGQATIYPRRLAIAEFNSCRIWNSVAGSAANMYYDEVSGSKILRFWNSILEGDSATNLRLRDDTCYVYHCICEGGTTDGLKTDAGTNLYIYNTAIYNTGDDLDGTIGAVDYCATDDNEGTNAQNLNENAGGEWTAAWDDYTTGDYNPKNDGLLYSNGNYMASEFTDLTGDTDPLATDMFGNSRTSRADIGPINYQAVVEEPPSAILGGAYRTRTIGIGILGGVGGF